MGLLGFAFALITALVLLAIPLFGTTVVHLDFWFGVVIPYLAVAIFFVGLVYRVIKWAKAPVPFKIPTTCGQAESLPWIKTNCVDNPTTWWGVTARMFMEVLFFRSLFRNTSLDFKHGRAYYGSAKWLWLFSLAFHYSFLVVILRHLRFFTHPAPFWVGLIEQVDGFAEVGLWPFSWLPGLYVSGVVLLGALTYLFLRRVFLPHLRYINLANDWFPIFLILHIAATGILMRYVLKTDVVAVKELTMSLVHFQPKIPEGIGWIFYVHLFQVCVLFAYFPFSKLMHAPGVFLSPTRNIVNDSRKVRHINPWNPEVRKHHYYEYEDDFREFMVEAGLPVDKELEASEAQENKE